jgi:hypothetical protein
MPNGWTTWGDVLGGFPITAGLPGGNEWGGLGSVEILDNPGNAEVTEVDENVTDAQLSQLIQSNQGHFDIDSINTGTEDDPYLHLAKSHWWKFSVNYSNDGTRARITENKYLLYGGLAVAGVVVVALLTRD